MNARKFKDFFGSKEGRFSLVIIAFVFFCLFAWFFIGSRQTHSKVDTVSSTLSRAQSGIQDLVNDVPRYHPGAAARQPPPPPAVQQVQQQQPEAIPIGIGRPAIEPVSLSPESAPYGRLVKCKLVITVDSSSLSTPIIGLVTEDVFNSYGDLIIPAGSEVHGTAQTDRVRERIGSDEKWVVVFNTHDEEELTLTGRALDQDVAPDGNSWGLTDGSAGLRGTVIKSDKFAELKIFAATFLAAGITGLESTGQNDYTGNETYQNTPKNAALQGASAVVTQYAQSILESVKRDGFFVRVPAGKQFYLYVTEPIDREKAQRGDSLFKKDDQNSSSISQAPNPYARHLP